MRNTLALTRRILQQFSHDPRTIVLFVVGPILVLWLFSVLLNSPAYQPVIATVDLPEPLVLALQDEDATCLPATADQAAELLASGEVDAVLSLNGTTLVVLMEGANPSRTSSVMQAVQSATKNLALDEREQIEADIQKRSDEVKGNLTEMRTQYEDFSKQLSELQGFMTKMRELSSQLPSEMLDTLGFPEIPDTMQNPEIPEFPEMPDFDSIITEFSPTVSDVQIDYLHGSSDWGNFDFFGPVFIGIFIFMFVFLTSGMSLVTERTGGTMERLLVTPIKPWQLVLGFCLGFGVVTLVQASIVLWASIALIGFPNEGSLLVVVTVTFSMALVSLNLGLLVSALARTPFQIIQFMLILVIPQVLLSGIFDLTAAPRILQILSNCFPITYGAAALRDIMLRGAGFSEVALNLGILWVFIVVFFVLASLSFARRKAH